MLGAGLDPLTARLAQPFIRQRWTRAVAQQTLQASAVLRSDAHRGLPRSRCACSPASTRCSGFAKSCRCGCPIRGHKAGALANAKPKLAAQGRRVVGVDQVGAAAVRDPSVTYNQIDTGLTPLGRPVSRQQALDALACLKEGTALSPDRFAAKGAATQGQTPPRRRPAQVVKSTKVGAKSAGSAPCGRSCHGSAAPCHHRP